MLATPSGQVDPNSKFMVLMIDEDVVQDNIETTLLHWFQPNMQIAGPATPLIAASNISAIYNPPLVTLAINSRSQSAAASPNAYVQTAYLAPSPPSGPPHRYVQVLLFQPSNFSVPACFQNILTAPGANASSNAAARIGFDINQFIAAADLPGQLIAGNFFRAQNPTPGSLTTTATASALANAMCPGVNALGAGGMQPMASMAAGMGQGMGLGVVAAATTQPGDAPIRRRTVRARRLRA